MAKIHHILAKIGDSLRSPFLLAIRLFWGWQFFITGRGKLENLPRVTEYFASLNLPHPHITAIVVAATECGGGLLLLAGLASRFVSLVFIVEMVVAYLTSEQEAIHAIFSDPDKFQKADPFPFLVISLIVFVCGAGLFSIDALLFRKPASTSRSGA